MNKRFLVLNPRASTYEIVSGPPDLKALAADNGLSNVDENGTYIGHRTPDLQVIEINDLTVWDLS